LRKKVLISADEYRYLKHQQYVGLSESPYRSPAINEKKVHITYQMVADGSPSLTPGHVEIIAAPGVGKIIDPFSVVARHTSVSGNGAPAVSVGPFWDGGIGSAYFFTFGQFQAGDPGGVSIGKLNRYDLPDNSKENTPLAFKFTDLGNLTDGDTMDIYILFRIISV
jgi:hypothetical protein